MSARSEVRCNEQRWREPIVHPQIHRLDVIRTAYRHHPAMARLLRIAVLRAACRERAAANGEKNIRLAKWHADEARQLDAVADLLKELA